MILLSSRELFVIMSFPSSKCKEVTITETVTRKYYLLRRLVQGMDIVIL